MNKTVLITGTSSGIGRAAVEFFAQKGWNVAATMRDLSKETELQKLPNVKLYSLDVMDNNSVQQAIQSVIQDFGNIDVLVNNAGYGLAGPLETATEEQLEHQFQTNVFGVMRTIKAVTPKMRDQKSGVIINITSIGGLVTFPFNSIYHATKFAVDGLSESLNYELNPFGIQVKVVAPGGVATDFTSRSIKMTFTPGQATPYDSAIAKVMTKFQDNATSGNYSTAQELAEAIYNAATDGTTQLRYVVGRDAQPLYAAWKQLDNGTFFDMVKTNFNLS